MIIRFSNGESASIKSFAVKKEVIYIEVISRFMSGKLLMFAKLSLKSFVYEVVETFCFQKKHVKKIYEKYKIERVEIFYILTDTDSTLLKIISVSDPSSNVLESKYRHILFEVISTSDTYKGIDSSHQFWDIFSLRKEDKEKN